jgi:hypothetical protein
MLFIINNLKEGASSYYKGKGVLVNAIKVEVIIIIKEAKEHLY